MEIKLVIFDFDGTIMDTKKTIVTAKQETMRQMGLAVADEQTCAGTIGLSAKMGFKSIYPDMADEMVELCLQKYRTIFDETMGIMPPALFPGIIETLNKLEEKNIARTIATARGRDSLKELLEKVGIADKFSYLLAAEDTTLLKPDAEPVLKTLADLSYNAENTLVVGDMPFDILMGKNAGTYTCGVTYGVSGKDSLIEAGADFIIDSIGELPAIV